MSFHLIRFANGDIAVVPDKWCDDGMVYWPKYKNTERAKRAAANSEDHEPNWPKYDMTIIRTCDNYKDACRIMEQYQTGCNTSDLQSEAEHGPPDKRQRRPVHRFGDSDLSEEDVEDVVSQLEALPVLPSPSQLPWQTPLSRRVPGSRFTAPQPGENCPGTGCSPDLLFFLCAMYAPICTIDFQHEPIKPCKAVCERAKSGCEPVMKLYNHSWPESLSCSELPLYDRGVCISPEAIVKAEGPDPYYQDPARCAPELSPDFPNNLHCKGPNEDRCTCKTVRLSLKTYLKNNYNYVIRARVKEVRTRGQELTATVEVKEVFKSSLVNIPRETNTLFYISSCPCPPLSPGVDYIILGYENKETSRLLLIEGSVAQKWKDRIGRKVKRWDQVLQERTSGRAAQRGVHH